MSATSPLITTLPVPAQSVERPLADFHPTVWGDYFLRYSDTTDDDDDAAAEATIRELVVKVKEMLSSESVDLLEKLELIDQMQRLGIAYHFDKELDDQLSKLHDVYPDFVNGLQSRDHEQLHTVSLFFRLLRQQGHNVSSEVFAKFKDDRGKFCETLVGDLRAMLSLYEASHMMIHGDDILEEALADTTNYLKLIDEEQHSPHLVNMARKALKRPIRKELPRLEAWHYIQNYQSDPFHNPVLLSLAKFDFNYLQKMHQKEVCEIVRWWKDWDFTRKTPFARDRVVENYLWAQGVYFEPEFALVRKFLAKLTTLLTVMDDMYDAYGRWRELEAFTEAFKKWDEVAMEGLPDYMQLLYKAYLDIYRQAEMELASQGRLYRLPYAIQSTKDQAVGYLAEAKWLFHKYTPMLDDEYITIATLTCGYTMLITNSLVGMGAVVTEEAFKWLSDNPRMLRATTIICRLMDDIVSHKFEQTRDHIASAVECYTKQYGGTKLEAEEALKVRVFDAWKDINEAFLRPFPVPEPVLTRVLNFTRVMDVLYKDGDNYTHSRTMTKSIITNLLVDPLPM